MSKKIEIPFLGRRIVPALFLVLSACSMAPLTEEEIYDREAARNEVADEFSMRKMECDDLGGIMIFEHYSGPRKNRKLTAAQMKSARCERTTMDAVRGVY